jgi:hypothetical protein
MTPLEIASTRMTSLSDNEEGARLHLPLRSGPIELPAIAMQHVRAYHALRDEAQPTAPHSRRLAAPLVSRLGSLTPLSSHRVWTLLQRWPAGRPGEPGTIPLGARNLRSSFIALATDKSVTELAEVQRHAGRLRIDASRIAATAHRAPGAVAQRVADALLAALGTLPPQPGPRRR